MAAAEHHERLDGSGYPKRLSQNAISTIGQMTSIVDVYDAITSIRVYHTALEPSTAINRIYEWRGRHFDKDLVQSFIGAMGIYPVSSLVRLESGRLAIVLRQGEKDLLRPFVRVVYNAVGGHRLPPKDVELASPNCQDYIVGHESPQKWGIDPTKYLGKV
jgi:HD-GYP domain-containing protein (c-di-GMP phosphodiesterase class II)